MNESIDERVKGGSDQHMDARKRRGTAPKLPGAARTSVLRQLVELQTLSMEQLREKWLELYDSKPPKYKKQFLVKRLAHRVQELFYGGLSESTHQRLKNVAKSDPMATVFYKKRKKKEHDEQILPGTRFVRIWRGKNYEVIAREKGFEFDGIVYRSLSAVACKITGAHWNGRIFFGVKRRPAPDNK